MATWVSRRDEPPAVRRATNVSLDTKLVEAAKEYGINVSRACEEGLDAEIRAERTRRWKEENREATIAWNEYIAKNGMPLERFRRR